MKIDFGDEIVLDVKIKESMNPQEACGYFEHLLRVIKSAMKQTESITKISDTTTNKREYDGVRTKVGEIINYLKQNPESLVKEIATNLGFKSGNVSSVLCNRKLIQKYNIVSSPIANSKRKRYRINLIGEHTNLPITKEKKYGEFAKVVEELLIVNPQGLTTTDMAKYINMEVKHISTNMNNMCKRHPELLIKEKGRSENNRVQYIYKLRK